MGTLVHSELVRRDKDRLRQYRDNQLRYVRRTKCVERFEIARAGGVGEELIRRTEWVDSPLKNDYGYAGEQAIMLVCAITATVALCVALTKGSGDKRVMPL